MNVMADAVPLRVIRESINVTREDIVKRTQSVSLGTIRNAEKGKRITHDRARQILNALNELLKEAGREPVTLDDLGLRLY
jgi:transcriptional regulator with XRE-family HTH domain